MAAPSPTFDPPRTPRRLDAGTAIPLPTTPIRGVLTSVCEDPGCLVLHLEVRHVQRRDDGTLHVSPEPGTRLGFDTSTGTVEAGDPNDEPEASWLRSLLDDGLTRWLHSRFDRHRDQLDEHTWRRRDWSRLSAGDLVAYFEAFPGPWDRLIAHEGTHYWVEDLHCINPRCDCQDVHLSFNEIRGKKLVRVGLVTVSLAREQATKSTSAMASTLWAELEETDEPFDQLRARRRRMRVLGQALRDEGLVTFDDAPGPEPEIAVWDALHPEPFRRPTAKVGRNEPCPCGSGRKHKRCCLGKPDASGRA